MICGVVNAISLTRDAMQGEAGRVGTAAAVVLAAVPLLASAQVFGSLDNFDVVNTIGHTA